MTVLQAFASRLGLSTTVELDPSGRPVPIEEDEQVATSYASVDLLITDELHSLGSGTLHVTSR